MRQSDKRGSILHTPGVFCLKLPNRINVFKRVIMLPYHYDVTLAVATLCQLGAKITRYLVTIVYPGNTSLG